MGGGSFVCRLPKISFVTEGVIIIKKCKTVLVRVLIVVFALISVACFVYPSVSTYIANQKQIQIIDEYNAEISKLSEKTLKSRMKTAQEYNQALVNPVVEGNNDESSKITINRGEMIGYIQIPAIEVNIPIYEGSNDDVLNKGVGHISNTSLPCVGKSTHCAIAGHSGLANAEMFTRLDELKLGDRFEIVFLDTVLKYKVDEIKVLTPAKAEHYVKPVYGKEYCTLITCTPVTVNTHRLLVRGKRITEKPISNDVEKGDESETEQLNRDEESFDYSYLIIALAAGFGLALLIIIIKRRAKS